MGEDSHPAFAKGYGGHSKEHIESQRYLQSSVFSLQSDNRNLQPSTFNLQPFLLIAGEGPERGAIERQIAGLPREVGERIRLVGHREDPCLFVASLDLHVMASTSIETIGYANIEAMFAGVPCIVSDVGGAKEIVRGSGGGLVVRSGNVEELREAMQVYVDDDVRVKEDGVKGKEYAIKMLTSDVMAQRVMDVYRNCKCEVVLSHKDHREA